MAPMKKKGGGCKKAAGVPSVAKAAGSACTPKKKTIIHLGIQSPNNPLLATGEK